MGRRAESINENSFEMVKSNIESLNKRKEKKKIMSSKTVIL